MTMKHTPQNAHIRRNVTKPSFMKRLFGLMKSKKDSPSFASSQDEESESFESKNTVVRTLIVILLLHIIVISSIWIRGVAIKDGSVPPSQDLSKAEKNMQEKMNGKGAQASPNLLQAPAQTPQNPEVVGAIAPPALESELIDEPVFDAAGTLQTSTAQTPPLPAPPTGVLPADLGQAPAPLAPANPPVVGAKAPQPSPSTPAVASGVQHLVTTGEDWNSIAKEYGCSVAALKQVNAGVTFRSGGKLQIPAPPGTTPAPVAGSETRPSGNVYVIKKGDNLYKIAKQNKTTIQKIMEVNGMDDKAARRLQIGQEIKLP